MIPKLDFFGNDSTLVRLRLGHTFACNALKNAPGFSGYPCGKRSPLLTLERPARLQVIGQIEHPTYIIPSCVPHRVVSNRIQDSGVCFAVLLGKSCGRRTMVQAGNVPFPVCQSGKFVFGSIPEGVV